MAIEARDIMRWIQHNFFLDTETFLEVDSFRLRSTLSGPFLKIYAVFYFTPPSSRSPTTSVIFRSGFCWKQSANVRQCFISRFSLKTALPHQWLGLLVMVKNKSVPNQALFSKEWHDEWWSRQMLSRALAGRLTWEPSHHILHVFLAFHSILLCFVCFCSWFLLILQMSL